MSWRNLPALAGLLFLLLSAPDRAAGAESPLIL
ncbi:MAG: hypothetical protein RJB55_1574, partial [Verrucomicrobiota bacterium]